jgi:hypothetical protein
LYEHAFKYFGNSTKIFKKKDKQNKTKNGDVFRISVFLLLSLLLLQGILIAHYITIQLL